MGNLGQNYDVNDLPQENDYAPLPAGWYRVNALESDVARTRDREGAYLKLRLGVVGPTHEGRIIFANVTLQNKSSKAVEIGQKQMGSLIRACGMSRASDSADFLGKTFEVKVAIRKSEEYGDQNEVKAYRAVEGIPQNAPSGGTQKAQAKPQNVNTESTAPWLR